MHRTEQHHFATWPATASKVLLPSFSSGSRHSLSCLRPCFYSYPHCFHHHNGEECWRHHRFGRGLARGNWMPYSRYSYSRRHSHWWPRIALVRTLYHTPQYYFLTKQRCHLFNKMRQQAHGLLLLRLLAVLWYHCQDRGHHRHHPWMCLFVILSFLGSRFLVPSFQCVVIALLWQQPWQCRLALHSYRLGPTTIWYEPAPRPPRPPNSSLTALSLFWRPLTALACSSPCFSTLLCPTTRLRLWTSPPQFWLTLNCLGSHCRTPLWGVETGVLATWVARGCFSASWGLRGEGQTVKKCVGIYDVTVLVTCIQERFRKIVCVCPLENSSTECDCSSGICIYS